MARVERDDRKKWYVLSEMTLVGQRKKKGRVVNTNDRKKWHVLSEMTLVGQRKKKEKKEG